LVRAEVKDVAVWRMIEVVRRCWPRLRWALVTENCSDQEEILARSLGAASVTSDGRVIIELASNRRRGK
jgi:hypothetical protein